MAKKARLDDVIQDIDLTDTFIGQPFMRRFQNRFLQIKLTSTFKGKTMTFPLPFYLTKVTPKCQGHNFVKNSTVILKSCLYLKGLWMKMKILRFLFAIMSKMTS